MSKRPFYFQQSSQEFIFFSSFYYKLMKITKSKLSQLKHQKAQKNAQKEAQNIMQLMTLPDFDPLQFLQNLQKSGCEQQVLEKIPYQKKVDFFAKRYQMFLSTQEQLLSLKMPQLDEVTGARQFKFDLQGQQKNQQNFQQSSVLQIIDSFSSAFCQKNTQETIRYLKMIQQMKQHSKFKPYFGKYTISKLFLQTYNAFLQNCNDFQLLLDINQVSRAIKVYLSERQTKILQQIRISIKMNDSGASMGKQMGKLVRFISQQSNNCKQIFKKYKQKTQQLNISICDWINRLIKGYYLIIQERVFAKQQLKDILSTLSMVIQASQQLQTKGITIQRQLKQLIANDLPNHIARVIQIILDSVSQILKDNNQLYQFVNFASIRKFSSQLQNLKMIKNDDFGTKCATTKGIILVNSFNLILQCLCEDKWLFLCQGVLEMLLSKIALNILGRSLHYWDNYFIYLFFERLAAGKVKHKQLCSGQIPIEIKQNLVKIKGLADDSWNQFQSKLTQILASEVLLKIPGELCAFQKYGYTLQKMDLRPSTFSLTIIFAIQPFLKNIQFRLSPQQFQYLSVIFFQYIIYSIQFVLFWSYHQKGTNDKVFSLHGKHQKLLQKIKQINFLQNQHIQRGQILQLSKLIKFGFLKLVFQVYFLADVIKILTKSKKIQAEHFVSRLAKVLSKDQKQDVIDVSRGQFDESLGKMVKVYQDKPEMMRAYLTDRNRASNA